MENLIEIKQIDWKNRSNFTIDPIFQSKFSIDRIFQWIEISIDQNFQWIEIFH